MADATISVGVESKEAEAGARRVASALASIEKSVDRAARSLGNIEKASRRTNKAFQSTGKSAKAANRQISTLSKSFKELGQATRLVDGPLGATAARFQTFSGIVSSGSAAIIGFTLALAGLGLGLREVIRRGDELTNLQNRLRVFTKDTREVANIQKQLVVVARETRVSLAATADIYSRLARSTDRAKISQQQLFTITESLNKAVIISGTTAQSAEAALVQLGQGLAANALRGQELNSVLEQTPRIGKAIADGLKVTIGTLRVLAAEGKLTAELVAGAIRSQKEVLDEEFSRSVATVSQASVVLSDAITVSLGKFNAAFGVTENLAKALLFLADNVDAIGNALIQTAEGIGIAILLGLGPVGATLGGISAGLLLLQESLKVVSSEVDVGFAKGLTDTLAAAESRAISLAVATGKEAEALKKANIEALKTIQLRIKVKEIGLSLLTKTKSTKDSDALITKTNRELTLLLETATRMKDLGEGKGLLSTIIGTGEVSQKEIDKATKRLAAFNTEFTNVEKLRKASNISETDRKQAVIDIKAEAEALKILGRTNIVEFDSLVERIKIKLEQEQAIKDVTAARKADGKEQERQRKAFEKAAQRPFKRVAKAIQKSFSDAFFDIFRSGELSFKKFADNIKDVFARTLAEMATLAATEDIIVPLVTNIGEAFGQGSAARSALAKEFGVDAGKGGGSSFFGDLFGAGGLKGSIDRLGTKVGLADISSDFVGPLQPGSGEVGTTFSDALSTAAGAIAAVSAGTAIGGALASALGDEANAKRIGRGGTIGGIIGAAIGTAYGGQTVAGAAIGSAAGSAIGGVTGSKPNPESSFLVTPTDEGVLDDLDLLAKHVDKTGAVNLANILRPIVSSFSDLGVDFAGLNIAGGTRAGGGFLRLITGEPLERGFTPGIRHEQFTGGRADVIPGSEVSFDDADQRAVSKAIGEFTVTLLRAAEPGNVNLQTALDNIITEGREAEEILNDVSFALNFTKLTTNDLVPVLSDMEQVVEDLNTSFDEAVETAKALGLAEEGVNKAREISLGRLRASFNQSIQDRLLGKLSPAALQLKQLQDEFNSLRRDAIAVGGDLIALEQLFQDERRELIQQSLNASIGDMTKFVSSIEDFQRRLVLDPELSGTNRFARAQEAEGQIAALAAGVASGDVGVLGEIEDTSQRALDAALDYYGPTAGYLSVLANVNQLLEDAKGLAGDAINVDGLMLTQLEQQTAILQQMIDGTTVQDFGGNVELNKQLASLTGFSDDFGGGRFTGFAKELPSSLQEAARALITSFGLTPGFAGGTGGSFFKGLAVVGEQGPELVNFDQGAQIFSNRDSGTLVSGASSNDSAAAEVREYRQQSGKETAFLGQKFDMLANEMVEMREDLTAALRTDDNGRTSFN